MLKKTTIGMRCLKTALASGLCAIVYFIIDRNPTFACIGAVFGMDNYLDTTPNTGGNRSIGTIIGGVLGCICFMLSMRFPGNISKALIMILGIILLIVVSQMLNAAGAIQAGCVVFFILLLNTPAHNYISYAINRMIDTLIGECVAFVINYSVPPYHRPYKNQSMFTIFK